MSQSACLFFRAYEPMNGTNRGYSLPQPPPADALMLFHLQGAVGVEENRNFESRISVSAKSEESLWKDPLPSRKGEA